MIQKMFEKREKIEFLITDVLKATKKSMLHLLLLLSHLQNLKSLVDYKPNVNTCTIYILHFLY